jgi:hypothetical protein
MAFVTIVRADFEKNGKNVLTITFLLVQQVYGA